MKFTVSSSALQSLLATTGKVISNKSSLPILEYFLMELKDGQLTVTTSDLETTLIGSITVENVEREGVIAAPGKLMLDSLKEFPEMPLVIEVNDTTWEIQIVWNSGHLSIPGASAVSYPAVQTMGSESKNITLDVDMLINGINRTIFATADDELRPVMNGVYFDFTPESLTFVATDAHKLVRYRRLDIKTDTLASFIVPKKPINQLKNALSGKADETVVVEFNKTNASFTMSGFKLVCRLIDGKYPNYEAVIPKANPNKLTIDRQLLLSAIRRVAIFSSKATHQIRFKIAGQELTLTAEDLDYYNEAKERLACNYSGDDMEIGFNSRFFQEMLGNLNQQEVLLEMSAPNRAGLILPVDNQNADEDILMLLMPVMLN